MSKKSYFLLYICCILFYSLFTIFQRTPGYMDAEYYYAGALQIAKGAGGNEPYLWNYLNAPAALPNPAFLYWMPLASLMASLGIQVFHSTGYFAARLPFILLAGWVPVMSAYLSQKFSNLKFAGWYAGILAILGGYYLPFVTQTDTFVLYMLGGGLFFILLTKCWSDERAIFKGWVGALALGILAGGMHLSRADGVLWLFAALGVLWVPWIFRRGKVSGDSVSLKRVLGFSVIIIAGYLVIMGGWYARNIHLFGALMPPDNGKNLWLTEYNDLFIYPSSLLTFGRWASSGAASIFNDRLGALWLNLGSLLSVSGGIVFFIFMVIGIVRNRKSAMIRYFLFLLAFGIFVMSFVFPYAGQRGGFFHSAAAFQCLLWALVPAGIDSAIELGVRKRNWQKSRSWKMFGSTMLVAFALLTVIVYANKVSGQQNLDSWGMRHALYTSANEAIVQLTGDTSSAVMVVDPPGFYLASQRPAVVTPQGNLDQVKAAAEKYQARFVVLDEDLTAGLRELYYTATQVPGFKLLETIGEIKIYAVEP